MILTPHEKALQIFNSVPLNCRYKKIDGEDVFLEKTREERKTQAYAIAREIFLHNEYHIKHKIGKFAIVENVSNYYKQVMNEIAKL